METQPDVQEYLASLSRERQGKMEEMRRILFESVPEATERISYGMPTLFLNGVLVHYGAFSKHLGFYPGPRGMDTFHNELQQYKTSKGAVQFPWEKPLPVELIGRVMRFRVQENQKR